jgi:hypothetical protein
VALVTTMLPSDIDALLGPRGLGPVTVAADFDEAAAALRTGAVDVVVIERGGSRSPTLWLRRDSGEIVTAEPPALGRNLIRTRGHDAALVAAQLRRLQRVLAAALDGGYDLVTPDEAADLLGVTPERFAELAAAPGFPRPAADGGDPRWLRAAITETAPRRDDG